ncbi:tetratricopeptide repeat protein [Acidovorax sp. RAC01]|uniref:tetratricopeptide repeat protein n=1 Tax=Acidovorax sp. RAC01 TaxID=1842533 RepID=UPI001E3A272D|nr:tetratricopeptide repeat protein [Acidovorax sp. RAC01]
MQPVERPVLASHWLTALLATMVGGALWVMFPRQDLERRLTSSTSDSGLSYVYLSNLLRSDPENPRLRALMAQHEAKEAAQLLAREAAQARAAELQNNTPLTLWNASMDEYHAIDSADTERRNAARAVLVTQLHALLKEDLPPGALPRLAAQAFQLEERALGIRLYRQMALNSPVPDEASRLYRRAAKEALAMSAHADAADLFLAARRMTNDPAEAKALFLDAISVMQASGKPAAALALAQREVQGLENDPEVLRALVDLARAAGKPAVAEQYMKRLLRLALLEQWQQLAVAQARAQEEARPAEPSGWSRAQMSDSTPLPAQAPQAPRYEDRAYLLDTAMLHHPEATGHRSVRTALGDTGGVKKGPGIPFDDKIYSLGYQVFLENSNLEDAWLVARSAVQQSPGDLAWRERLARVSEWTQRGSVALDNWLVIARRTQKDEAWQAVLRLAPGLFQDEALVEGLMYELRRQPGNAKLVRELVEAYERIGTPQPAMDFLARQPATEANLELLAELATRAGHMDVALKSWEQLFANADWITPERAMRASVLALLRGRAALGMSWLEAARARVTQATPDAADFLRMTGQLAERQQRDATALDAYRALLATNEADLADYDTLIRLLQNTHPAEAADVSLLAWDRFDQPRHLVAALTHVVGRSQWPAVGKLLQRIDPAPHANHHALQPLLQAPEFLRLAGLYHQNTGNLAKAVQMFETALQLEPEDAATQQALIWLFIDANDNVSLRKLLSMREAQWSKNTEMHDALGSAYQALSLPAVALERYFRPRIAAHQTDFLWLMNYADALDQNQETDKSWRLRKHLLSEEWAKAQGGQPTTRTEARQRWLSDSGLEETRRNARARLLLLQKPGDPALDALRELLRLDRDAQGKYSNAAAETAIGWFQDAGEYSAERAFLWHQYARSQSLRANRPLWADITVALAEKDLAATGQLLETFGERLPRYDRVNAAAAVQDVRMAQTAAFETQQDQPDDAPLHLQLTENLLAFSDHAGAKIETRDLRDLQETETSATLRLALTPRLSLQVAAERIERTAGLTQQLSNPSQERGVRMELRWQDNDSTTTLQLGRRESLAAYTPVHLEQEWRIDSRLSLRMDAGLQLPTQESAALRMAGMKDRVGASVRYQASRLDQFTAEHWQERYRLQTGAEVGRGRHYAVAYTHSYRIDVPTLDFGVFWSNHAYDRRDPSLLSGNDLAFTRYLPPGVTDVGESYFLPENFSFYGLQVSTNMRFERDYTRAWQPYASVARTWHSRQGAGYSLRLGVAGSVWGADHLNLNWSLTRGGTQSPGLNRTLQLNYRKHY